MPQLVRMLKYGWPALAWMAVIYSASADQESGNKSSRFIAPLLRWLFGLEGEALSSGVLAVRKLAHVTEYAILAVLVLWAIRSFTGTRRVWSSRLAAFTLTIVILYAISDEIHQSFVPTRIGTPVDVLIDAVGGLVGIGLYWCAWRWWQRRGPDAKRNG